MFSTPVKRKSPLKGTYRGQQHSDNPTPPRTKAKNVNVTQERERVPREEHSIAALPSEVAAGRLPLLPCQHVQADTEAKRSTCLSEGYMKMYKAVRKRKGRRVGGCRLDQGGSIGLPAITKEEANGGKKSQSRVNVRNI